MGYKAGNNKRINKTNKKLIDTDHSMMVTREEGGRGRTKRIKGVKYIEMEGE